MISEPTLRSSMKCKIALLLLLFPAVVFAQLNNFWSQNFNDESSLLAGAVVGGGAGASSIFYNPATISEIKESKLSLNASLFSFDFIDAKNFWGENINYRDSRIYVTPRFLSYMMKPRKIKNWSFEVAFLNVSNQESEDIIYVRENIDILKEVDGIELYTANGLIKNRYRDDWVGIGGSHRLNDHWSFGSSMFISFLTQSGYYNLQLNARPTNTAYDENATEYHIAAYDENEMILYNDYRLLWKFGIVYTKDKFSLGLNITSPVVSGIYSDGKRIQRRRSQTNISNPETGELMNDYLILDYAEKKDVTVRSKTPLSIALGAVISNSSQTSIFYSTMEYFFRLEPYALVSVQNSPGFDGVNYLNESVSQQWLSYVQGARPLVNIAVGNKWYVKENLMILAGFKTDFNYMYNYNLTPYSAEFSVKSLNFNKYHFTAGSTLHVFGQDITAGLQYTMGRLRNQKQIANLSDPVEFNTIENKPLQGTRTSTMNSLYNSISIYIAATLNFNRSEENKPD